MDSEHWKKIEEIFQAALDLSVAEREGFIAKKCGDDVKLRSAVEKYIACHENEDSFLESPVWTDSRFLQTQIRREIVQSFDDEINPEQPEKSYIGERIGVYRITGQIGKGGMGVVYLAERADGEFEQKVALKLIKRGMDTDFIVKRFRHERQIAASLNHPNIARLLDGGTTNDDLPYFVMEYIEGKPFFEYSRANKLDLREKLELFLEVCAAVAYAHKRKIIHRDIKPGNILVSADGEPKLLDFGIAKILDPDLIHESVIQTATQMRLMTPEYASPEQVRGEEISEASDQYSLGVLLYELLTENRPYKFPSRSPHEIARIICEEIPSEPSSNEFGKFITADKSFLLDPDFCQKLDRLVMKSLRKKPLERYASVKDFAADIERFLRNENVCAESFEIETDGKNAAPTVFKVHNQTQFVRAENELIPNKTGLISAAEQSAVKPKGQTLSPRRKGVKQGSFSMILAFLLIPFVTLLTATGIFLPQWSIFFIILFFFGGLIRIAYALLFESDDVPFALPIHITDHSNETTLLAQAVLEPQSDQNKIEINAEPTTGGEKSIAVLPFKTFNPQGERNVEDESFLSIGLADALMTRLSKIRQLVVRPTSSVLRFGAGGTDPFAAGKNLNADFVLDGNFLKTGSRIRVSVQLLSVADRSLVWAERFDEDYTDVLLFEDRISEKVASSLLPKLPTADRLKLAQRGTDLPGAYEAYLRGRFYRNMFSDESLSKAYSAYREAISYDPDYALAYAGIADYYIWVGVNGVVPPTDSYPLAKDAARRSIELDGNLADAYASLAFAQICGDYDWIEAEKNAARAVELAPNHSAARLWYSYVLLTAERFDESLVQAKRAVELDPQTYVTHHVLALNYFMSRRLDEAAEHVDVNVKNFAGIGLAHHFQSWVLRNSGRHADAISALRRATDLAGDSLFMQITNAQTLAAAGRRAETEEILRSVYEQGKNQYISYYQIAIVYAYLNESEKALDALERAYEDREGWLIWLRCEPALDRLRNETRFIKLRKKLDRRIHDTAIDSFDYKLPVSGDN